MPNTTLPSPLVSRSAAAAPPAAVVPGASLDAAGCVVAVSVATGVVDAGCVTAADEAAVVAVLESLSSPHAAATTDINASAASVRPVAVPNLRLFTSISPLCRGLMVRPSRPTNHSHLTTATVTRKAAEVAGKHLVRRSDHQSIDATFGVMQPNTLIFVDLPSDDPEASGR